MSFDPHQIRMGAGASAADVIGALDDEAIALFEPVAEALYALVDQLKANGLPPASILQVLVGAFVAAAFRDAG